MTGALGAIHYVKGTVFILQHLLQPSIIVRSLWLIRENLMSTVFIRGKQLQPCSFKGAYLFHRICCSNFCLQPPHSFILNVLIWQISTRRDSQYLLWKWLYSGTSLKPTLTGQKLLSALERCPSWRGLNWKVPKFKVRLFCTGPTLRKRSKVMYKFILNQRLK